MFLRERKMLKAKTKNVLYMYFSVVHVFHRFT